MLLYAIAMERTMPVLKTENEWLTPAEAAEYLRVAHSTIYRWAKSGAVTLYRVGEGATRLKRSEVEAMARPLPRAQTPAIDLVKREACVARLLAMRHKLGGRGIDLGSIVTEERRALNDRA